MLRVFTSMLLCMFAIVPLAASAQGAPFACNSDLYLVRAAGSNASLFRFPASVLGTGGTAVNVWGATTSPGLNAAGLREQDGFIYSLSATTGQPQLYRIGQTTSALVGAIATTGAQSPAITTSFLSTAGTFDAQGRFYFAGQGGAGIVPAAIYRVDTIPAGTGAITVAAVFPLSSALANVGDMAFGPDGNLYAATGNLLAQIVLPAPAVSGATAVVTTATLPSSVGGVGSAFFNTAGEFFVYENGGGQLRRVAFTSGAGFPGPLTVGSPVSITGTSGGSATDGASCVTPPQADLRITKTNTPGQNGDVDLPADSVTGGTATVYTIRVENLGPAPANSAVVNDIFAGLACATASCTASGGASCPPQTGAALVSALQGAGAVIPTLPAAGSLAFTLSCTVL
ncbi:MAG: DUF6923 family protein [Silanimonas sp.]